MPNTIDFEAKKSANLIIDVDKHRRRYLKRIGNVSIKFISPIIETYEKFRWFILKNSVLKDVPTKYFYRPDYFSYQEYGTTTLWTLLLFINDMRSIEEFKVSEILVPDYGSVLEIVKFNELSSTPQDVDLMNLPPSRAEEIVLYTSRVSAPLEDINSKTTVTQEEEPVFFVRQRFTLSETLVYNKFVDLGYIPVIESANLKVDGIDYPLLFEKHYNIVDTTNGELRRLSWSDADNRLGTGLESILSVGSVLEVTYAKET